MKGWLKAESKLRKQPAKAIPSPRTTWFKAIPSPRLKKEDGMNWEELRVWANNPARTRAELQAAASGLTLTTGGNVAQLRNRVLGRIAAEADLTNGSAYTPPGYLSPEEPTDEDELDESEEETPPARIPPVREVVHEETRNNSLARRIAESELAMRVVGIGLAMALLAALVIFKPWQRMEWFTNNDTATSATATATITNATTATATATSAVSNINRLDGGKAPVFNTQAFRHPNQFVQCSKTFAPVNTEVDWLLCEPGLLLTNTATFTRPEVDAVYQTNCPEGGFWYGSMHHGKILLPESAGGVALELKDYGPGTNHLLVIRCKLSDGKRDSDLNFTMRIGNFVVGHAIWSPIPANHPDGSAYVSMEWFGEQLITSHTTGGTNCGSDGCSKVYVNIYDVNSQRWQELLVTNIKGESGDADKDGIVDYDSGNWERVSSNK